jgi:hypothetical protein
MNQRTLPARPKSTFQISPGLGLVDGIQDFLAVRVWWQQVVVVVWGKALQKPVSQLPLLRRRQLLDS